MVRKLSGLRARMAGIIALVLLLGALSAAPPAFADDPPADAQSDEAIQAAEGLPPVGQKLAWADLVGAPTIPASTVGLWVWSEDVNGQEVLRIRSGSDGAPKTFTGSIRTYRIGNFYDLAPVNGTGDDTATLTQYNELTFSLATTGGGEGLDVSWSGTWLVLDLKMDGAYVPSKILIGAAGKPTTGAPLGTRAGPEGLLALPLTMLDGPTSFALNAANGYYLYRDAQGRYHMRLTTTSTQDNVTYKGRVVSELARFRVVREFRGDPRDYVRLTDRGTALEFKFHTRGHIDGLDWVLKGKDKPDNMILTLRLNDGMAAPNIALGSNGFGTVKAFTFRLVE